jgi:hypothetical protein
MSLEERKLTAVEVVAHVSKKYGLTGLEMVHYKGEENFPTSFEDLDIHLVSRTELSDTMAVELINEPRCLLIYENKSLNVFVVVIRKKGKT